MTLGVVEGREIGVGEVVAGRMHQAAQERCKLVPRIDLTGPIIDVCGPDRDQNRRIAAGDDRAPRGFVTTLVSCLEIEQRLGICS